MSLELEIPSRRIPALSKLVHLSAQTATELLAALSTAKFSAKTGEMVEQIKGSVSGVSAEDLSEIVDALYELYFVREFSSASPTKFLRDLMVAVEDSVITTPDPALLATTRTRLKGLLNIDTLKSFSKGIGLQRDEERLYCESKIVSAIRPVFANDPKSPPVGAVISHTLKISYHEGNEHRDFFVVLDKSDLDSLKSVIERAHSKAKTLTDFLKVANLPDLGM